MAQLADAIRSHLATIPILPQQFRLDVPDMPYLDASLLRGVWGAALHDLDPVAFREMFKPDPVGTERDASRYVVRLTRFGTEFIVQWILIGDAIQFERSLSRAWDIASGMGLGRDRRRFQIHRIQGVDPDGNATDAAERWSLDRCAWPASIAITGPSRLSFPGPLRLMRKPPGQRNARSMLILQPTLTDIIVSVRRRLGTFLPATSQDEWRTLARAAEDLSRVIPVLSGPWQPCDLHRPKEEDIRRGVRGSLLLPQGPADLWPLLAAAQWLHIGKSTIEGLGRMLIEPASPPVDDRIRK